MTTNGDAPRVSYILCTLNRAAFIERALANVREYISPCDELIVADGGSTDGTLEVIERSRDVVSTLIMGPDRGEAHALNRCILAARGKYIKFVTDDDEFDPVVMRASIDYLENNPSVDGLIVGGTTMTALEDGTSQFRWQHCLPSGVTFRDRVGTPVGLYISGLGFTFRREAFSVTGLFDIRKKYVDVDFMVQLLRSPLNVQYMNSRLFQHNLGPQSGAWQMHRDERFRLESAEGFIKLGDWNSATTHRVDDIMRVMRLPGDIPGVKPALELLCVAIRLRSRLLDTLLRTILCLKGPLHWARNRLRGLSRRTVASESGPAPIARRQLSVSTDPNHDWNGEVW